MSTIVTVWAPIQEYPFLGPYYYEMGNKGGQPVHFLDECNMDMSMRLSPTIDGHSFFLKKEWVEGSV